MHAVQAMNFLLHVGDLVELYHDRQSGLQLPSPKATDTLIKIV